MKTWLHKHFMSVVAAYLAFWATGCTKMSFLPGQDSSSATSSLSASKQSESFSFDTEPLQKKADILMVIDNSASMKPLQANLTANFASFIYNFVAMGYDFHLSVTTTDAYKSLPQFGNDPSYAKFRDGAGSNHSGVYTILPSTPDLLNLFVINASQGADGSGDERAFSSFKAALSSPFNAGFLRPDSFLSIIILSDEDDFSDPYRTEASWIHGGVADHDYSDPTLEPVSNYVHYLDGLTGSTPAHRRYSVSTLGIFDQRCLDIYKSVTSGTEPFASIIGQRYFEIAHQTNGIAGSICDQGLSSSLAAIGNSVINNTTATLSLKSSPVEGSVEVDVNPIDKSLTWTVSGSSIRFNKTPAKGTKITVKYNSK